MGEGRLVAVSGPAVRSFRGAVRQMEETLFVFTVGPQLNVWLKPDIELEVFRRSLSRIDSRLKVEPVVATLHDAAVRDLALAAEQGKHAG